MPKKENLFQNGFWDSYISHQKYPFFCNCGSHHCLCKPSKLPKRKFYSKMWPSKLPFLVIVGPIVVHIPTIKFSQKGNFILECGHQKYPFLVIVGPIVAYITHQTFLKRNFFFKNVVIKISFFSNCGSHHCLYKPSKLPKKEILFQNVAIKIAFFGNCGSMSAYISHQTFLKR